MLDLLTLAFHVLNRIKAYQYESRSSYCVWIRGQQHIDIVDSDVKKVRTHVHILTRFVLLVKVCTLLNVVLIYSQQSH